MVRPRSRVSLRNFTIIIIALGLFGIFNGAIEETVVVAYENVAFAIAPSAERADVYGQRHLDARQFPGMYDIRRAEYFYKQLETIDPTYPYLYHQLARIEFLGGHFHDAIAYIDKEIAAHGADEPNTYYVRGLIEGYMGRYDKAAADYAIYLRSDPKNWAAINDYAWVLLKANRPEEALAATEKGIQYFPTNAWLLNSHAIALSELHRPIEALEFAKRASVAVANVNEAAWLRAYPGNDPKIAGQGIAALTGSIEKNLHAIELALSSSTPRKK